jgi:hypothetical protein
MAAFARIRLVMLSSAACSILAACGADGVASPGEGVIVVPAPTTPTTPGTTTPTPTGVTPAASCPNIDGADKLADLGTITGPQGTWRNCAFPARFNSSTAIPKVAGVVYSLPGRVDVGTDQGAASTNTVVTLTIDPGVVVFGATGVSYLVVNRGNKIDAVGTPTQPIIFTGRGNVVGSAGDQTSQLWGGVVLLGRAPVTDCLAPGAAEGTAACQRDTEGTSNALYGGAQPGDSSGRMSYVQIRYSGFVLSADKELQGLTPSGVGSGTQLDHIQIHNSSDDGIEVFGGRPNMKHLVITGAEDDSLDTDVGYQGNIQYVIAVQRAGGAVGDSMMEIDSDGNENAVPRQRVAISNFTFVQRNNGAGNGAAIRIRGGADYMFANGLIVAPGFPCLRIDSATTTQTSGPDEQGPPKFFSVSMQCNATPFRGSNGVTNAEVEAIFNAGTDNRSNYVPSLANLFVNGATETLFKPYDAKTLNAFFDTTAYVGAVRDASDTWYRGWTCNSATADFGAESGSCSALPVA